MKKDNKGFSLIELIIVIAIMAVLVVVLAPQFTKYIERGRKSTDVQSVAEIVTALEVYAADPMATVKFSTTEETIDLSTTETAVGTACSGGATGAAATALTDAGITKVKLSSSLWGSGVQLGVKLDTNGNLIVEEKNVTTGLSLLKGTYN